MMKYKIEDDEIEALKSYRGFNYEQINQLLTSNCETDIELLREGENNTFVTLSKDFIFLFNPFLCCKNLLN